MLVGSVDDTTMLVGHRFHSNTVTVTLNVTVTFCDVNSAPYLNAALALEGFG